MEAEKEKLTAPYVPFKTFMTALDHLKAITIPNKVDRAVFPSHAGIIQGQLIGAFRFLGLIDEHGKPHSDLALLAVGEKERKAALKDILKKRYSELVSLDLTRVSPSQFDDAISKYGVGGTTHQKAKSFFLKAAQYAELPLSPLLTRKTRNSGESRRKRSTAAKVVHDPNISRVDQIPFAQNLGTTKKITLHCGGQLTLSVDVNLFDLDGDDRNFVFGLIDQIQIYEKGRKEEAGNEA
jgi:hypothetical protein